MIQSDDTSIARIYLCPTAAARPLARPSFSSPSSLVVGTHAAVTTDGQRHNSSVGECANGGGFLLTPRRETRCI